MRLPKKVIIMSGNEFHPFYSAGLSQCRKKEKKAIRLYWNSRESAGKRKRSGHVGCCHQLTLCFALFYWISTIASFQSTPRRHLRRKLTIDPFTAEIRPQFRPHLADFLQRWRRRIPHPTHSFFFFLSFFPPSFILLLLLLPPSTSFCRWISWWAFSPTWPFHSTCELYNHTTHRCVCLFPLFLRDQNIFLLFLLNRSRSWLKFDQIPTVNVVSIAVAEYNKNDGKPVVKKRERERKKKKRG